MKQLETHLEQESLGLIKFTQRLTSDIDRDYEASCKAIDEAIGLLSQKRMQLKVDVDAATKACKKNMHIRLQNLTACRSSMSMACEEGTRLLAMNNIAAMNHIESFEHRISSSQSSIQQYFTNSSTLPKVNITAFANTFDKLIGQLGTVNVSEVARTAHVNINQMNRRPVAHYQHGHYGDEYTISPLTRFSSLSQSFVARAPL